MSLTTSQQHKVFLQKRSLSGEMKQVPGQIFTTMVSPLVTPMVSPKPTISCSLCSDVFPGAKELGLHILTAHCDAHPETPSASPNIQQSPNVQHNVVIEGSPGMSMEVEVDPLEPTVRQEVKSVQESPPQQTENALKSTPTTITPRQQGLPALNLPRQPTPNELKQKFMIYRLSDTSSRYICLVCDKMYTSRYNIRMHMNLHSGNNVHKCAFCGRNFAHKHVYESHVRTHTGERPFSCGKCERKFGDRSNCSSHRKRCTGSNSGPTPPESPVPAVSPINPSNLKSGQSINIAPNVSITPINKSKKADSSDTSESGIFEYPEMDTDTLEDLALTFEPQIVSVQSISANEPDDKAELINMGYIAEEDDDEDDDSEEMMIEPDISLDYDDIEELIEEPEAQQSHSITILTAQKPVSTTIFTCSFCNVKYSQQPMLLEHLSTHIDIPSEPTQSDIEQGFMAIYYTSRPKFMCLSCGKLFATAESVNLHLNIHYEDKIYACEHCEKIFAHKHVYESHRKISHQDKEKSQEYDCKFCNNIFPNSISLNNHERSCKLKPKELPNDTQPTESIADKMILQIQTPVNKDALTLNNNLSSPINNNTQESPRKIKPKANRPPPKLILLNSDTSEYNKKDIEHDEHIIINEPVIKTEKPEEVEEKPRLLTLAPKPTMTLLSDEAKKIFNTSAPQRRSSGSNPRAHKIIDTDHGREYIPDTNSNNIIHLEGIYPPPDSSEHKKGYMLRPVGPGGQQRYICVECGKHYTTSYNVRMHRNIHLGKNLYTCKFCNKEFSHKHVWETHERVHTGERPFKCPTCPKDFADRSNYNSHKKICLRLQQQAFGTPSIMQS